MSNTGDQSGWLTTQYNSDLVVRILWEHRRNQTAHLHTAQGSPMMLIDLARLVPLNGARIINGRIEARIDEARIEARHAPPAEVPRFGEMLLCIFTKVERQQDRLGDFEERFREWERKFGMRAARRLYLLHALRSADDLVKIGIAGAIVDWLSRWFR
jgi:hypothetical protein